MDFQRVLSALRRSNDITLLTTFQQDADSAGSIISLSDNDTVYLGLQVSSHKRELRLKYVDVEGTQRSEIFDTRKLLVDNTLHKLAVSISGSEVQVFYDCHSIFKRPLERMPDRNFSASNMTLFVGQERLDRNFIFKVSLEIPLTALFSRPAAPFSLSPFVHRVGCRRRRSLPAPMGKCCSAPT